MNVWKIELCAFNRTIIELKPFKLNPFFRYMPGF